MLKIGLTGGIGSGKSSVAAIFNVLGTPVFDADNHAKLIMETDETLASSVKNMFGTESYIEGKLNRAYIANLVFNNPGKLHQLNSLVHPATILQAGNWMKQQVTPYVIKEAALIFEAGSRATLDYVIGVSSPEALRIIRVMHRDNITKEQVALRMKRQMDEETKMNLCDFVIVNDEQKMLIPQVLALHEKFINKSLSQ